MSSRVKQRRIVVIGELNVDVVATGLSAMPRLGEEVLVADYGLALGSASAIFASGAAKLGHPVTFVSRVGADGFADFCTAALEKVGISTERVERVPTERTGVTLSLSTPRDRALVTYLGAIATFAESHVDRSAFVGARHLHMTSYFLQRALRPSFPAILKEAKGAGLSTSFDPNSDPASAWGRGFKRVLDYTDVLLLNDREALEVTKARDVNGALKALGADVRCVVVKRGAKGAVAIQDGVIARATGFVAKTVDTTGAGDSFAAGFVSAWLGDRSLGDSLNFGNACGALSTRRAGGTAGQPNTKALRRFLREHAAVTPSKHDDRRSR